MVDGNSWFELAQDLGAALVKHDITAHIAAGRLKTAVLQERTATKSAAEPHQKPNDIKTALIYEDDKSTTCRKPPLRKTV